MSQKIYNICDMKTELKPLILKRIKEKKLKAFSCFDFTDFAPYKTVSKCLERLQNDGDIIRIISGIYSLNKYEEILHIQILPSIDDVVVAIARKNNWIISPSGNTALNVAGLSTQVVASYTYLTTGPYKEYVIYGNKVVLKRTMNREINSHSPITNLLIQCIKAIGENNIEQYQIDHFKNKLSQSDKDKILKETTTIQTWIRNIILIICR